MTYKHNFSTQELEFASNPTYMLIKRRVMEKMESFLSDLQVEFYSMFANCTIPADIMIRSPKISKGENYRNLPFLVLDYPAHFTKEHIFAIRCMFHWGNFLSMTLHLQGNFHKQYYSKMIELIKGDAHLSEKSFFCINSTPWDYHYQSSNYIAFKKADEATILDRKEKSNFSKFSIRKDINAPESAREDFILFFRKLLHLLEQ